MQNRLKTIRSGFGCDTEEEENVLRAYITYLAVARPVLNQYRPQCMHDVAFRAMVGGIPSEPWAFEHSRDCRCYCTSIGVAGMILLWIHIKKLAGVRGGGL